jgi:hypothetical protein
MLWKAFALELIGMSLFSPFVSVKPTLKKVTLMCGIGLTRIQDYLLCNWPSLCATINPMHSLMFISQCSTIATPVVDHSTITKF